MEGFIFDGQGFVVNSESFDKMDKEVIKNTEIATVSASGSRRNSVRLGGTLRIKTAPIPEIANDSSTSSLTEKLSDEICDEVLSNRAEINTNQENLLLKRRTTKVQIGSLG